MHYSLINESDNKNKTIKDYEGSVLDTSQMFTDRDLEQSPDLTEAVAVELESGTDVTIDQEGIYVLSGDVTEAIVIVDVDDEAKVQLVLDGVSIVNDISPAIYVKTADKVFVTLTDSDNYLEVSGSYAADGDTYLDAVIFSKSDLVLNGTGLLEILSVRGNGITSKDDLKVTGGAYVITAYKDALEANDSIRIYDGEMTIDTQKDALHSENDEDTYLGYIYIQGGTININVDGRSAFDANNGTQLNGGEVTVNGEVVTEITQSQMHGNKRR